MPRTSFFVLPLLALSAISAHAGLRETATPDTFGAYTRSYTEPRLLETNSAAFDARLKLLDAAPKGAHARLATFEFLNGEAVRRFARHACLAAQRGVRVELIVDSKNGDRPGEDDAFDGTADTQVAEEILQYLANCGVEVQIYNHIESWISVLGMRIPNLYGDSALDGTAVNPFGVLAQVDKLLDRIGQIGNEELLRSGVHADLKPLLKNLRGLAFELFQLVSIMKNASNDAEPPDGYDASVSQLERLYLMLLEDPVWDAVPPAKLKDAIGRFIIRAKADPMLHGVYDVIRRYNRVQHRKVFVVENGSDGCMIIGGRNLGDAYLTDQADSFLDGDVLLCRSQGAEASRAVDEGGASFENLKTDRSGRSSDLVIRTMPKNSAYAFRNLIFPSNLAPRGLVTAPYSGELPENKRTLLPERIWRDEGPVLGEAAMTSARNWHVLRATWDPAEDQISQALLERIGREKKEIYLEIAYAEFGPELRAAIESALQRGVRVQLVTNSFFVTDGMSKAIRALMANWQDSMRSRYPSRFTMLLTSFEAGHMIHLKAAAFGCQPGDGGAFTRSYLLGSHNFHPRSGRSDKENSISWEEPSTCDALGASGFVHERVLFYTSLSRRLGHQLLTNYPDFHAELQSASLEKSGDDFASRWISRALRQMIFLEGETETHPKDGARLKKVIGVAEGGGLTDLIGLLL